MAIIPHTHTHTAGRDREPKTEAKPIIRTHRFYPKIHTIGSIHNKSKYPAEIHKKSNRNHENHLRRGIFAQYRKSTGEIHRKNFWFHRKISLGFIGNFTGRSPLEVARFPARTTGNHASARRKSGLGSSSPAVSLSRFSSLNHSLSVSLWFSLSSSVWVRWIGREKEQIRRKERKEKKEQEGKRRKWEEREWFGLLVPFLFLPISRSLTLSLSLPVSLRKESKGRNGKEGERRRKKRRKEKQFSEWGAEFAWRRV
jgi:hypothetical protein